MIEYIAPTPRKKRTKPARVRIFLDNNGICCLCGLQIKHGEKWFIEHPEAVNLGGSDDAADLRPAHYKCKSKKDASDAKLIAKRNAIIDKDCVDRPRKRLQSRNTFQPYKPNIKQLDEL